MRGAHNSVHRAGDAGGGSICIALRCAAFPPCCVSSDGSRQRRASLPLSAYCAQALLDPLFADRVLLDIPAEDKIFFGVVAYGRA